MWRSIRSLWFLLLSHTVHGETLPWRRLEFHLDHLLTVQAKLRLEPRARAQLVPRSGALQGQQVKLYHLEIDTKLKWFLTHRVWHGDLWFDDLTALQRIRTKLGKKGYRKVFRYGEKGVWRLRYRPGEEIPRSEQFFPKPPAFPCPEVSDPYALLYFLSRPKLPSRLCVFNKEEYYRLRLVQLGSERVEVSYRDGVRKRSERITLEKIQLVPLSIGERREDFEFLGMEGEILFWRDPETGLILRIEGKVPRFGHAVLKLKRVDR